jgi:hypothetical protein
MVKQVSRQYTIPSIQSWEVIFYTATDNGKSTEFKEANVALRTTVKEVALPKVVDTLPLDLVDLTNNPARDILGKLICS